MTEGMGPNGLLRANRNIWSMGAVVTYVKNVSICQYALSGCIIYIKPGGTAGKLYPVPAIRDRIFVYMEVFTCYSQDDGAALQR